MPEIDDPAVLAALDASVVDPDELAAALAGKAPVSHNHDGIYQPADTALTALAALNDAPVGAGADQVAHGYHSHATAIPNVEDGFLSGPDKAKLDGIEPGATAYKKPAWGDITGTLANQTDLNGELAGKAASSHTHSYPGMLCLHKTWAVGSDQTLTAGTAATVAFDTLRKSVTSAPNHSISSGVVTFAATGSVHVEAQLTIADTSSTTKGSVSAQFEYNDGGGYDAIGDVMTVVVPASNDPDLTCTPLVISAEVDVTAGQSLKLVATAKSGNANCTVRAGSKLLVKGIG